IDLEDDEHANVEKVLEETRQFIGEGTKGNNRIFVHCLFGLSRSALVVIDYLHRNKGLKMFNAFFLVATARPQINLNAGFKRYL
ncbi:phosphatases II, partial [Fomitiporia mediterranea MF3/22]